MDYSSMKKEDLIKLLVEQRHLADAVEAKDAEINALRTRKDQGFEAIQKEKDALKLQYETQIANLKDQIRMVSEQLDKAQNHINTNKFTKEAQDKLLVKNAELVDFGNKYIKLHTNMIKYS